MGVTYYSCSSCNEPYDSYAEGGTCTKCKDDFCPLCKLDLTQLAGVGVVCSHCHIYNGPAVPKDETLLKYALEKLGMSEKQLRKEYMTKQPYEVLPCYKCKSTTCKETHKNELDVNLSKEECRKYGIDNDESVYGVCCRCCEERQDKCEACHTLTPKPEGEEPRQKKQK